MSALSRLLLAAAVSAMVAGGASANTLVQKNEATLRALDKITGRSADIVVKVDQPVVFGSLRVELRACFQA
ncbi:MAG: DUF2155 domain-containing protein, partial [Dietzia cercidiphylli]